MINRLTKQHVTFKQKSIAKLFSFVPVRILSSLLNVNLIVPYYHMVSDQEVPHIKYLYPHKNIKEFSDDLDYLLRHFYPIHLKDLLNLTRGCYPLPANCFLLTFDDGFREMYDVVTPILINKGVPAIFFVNSQFMNNNHMCYQHKASLLIQKMKTISSAAVMNKIVEVLKKRDYFWKRSLDGLTGVTYQEKELIDEIALIAEVDFKEYLGTEKPYLDSNQVKKLIAEGFSIGAHSVDHPIYSEISLENQLKQTLESVTYVRQEYGLDYGVFAFPHTERGGRRIFYEEMIKSRLIDITFGTRGMIYDNLNIQRCSLEKPMMPAREILALEYARRVIRIVTRKDVVNRRGC